MTRVVPGVLLLGLCATGVSCHRGPRPATPGAATPALVVNSRVDQVNMPPWEGGWSIIGRGSTAVRFSQTFTPLVYGVLRFDFTSPDVMVTPGIALHLRVEDTNKDVFGWRYGRNTYPGGSAYFNGAPWNNGAFDFRFRTYGS
jgi:hypothetical protein